MKRIILKNATCGPILLSTIKILKQSRPSHLSCTRSNTFSVYNNSYSIAYSTTSSIQNDPEIKQKQADNMRIKKKQEKLMKVRKDLFVSRLPTNIISVLESYLASTQSTHSTSSSSPSRSHADAHPKSIPFLNCVKSLKDPNSPAFEFKAPYNIQEQTKPVRVIYSDISGYGICITEEGWLISVPAVLKDEWVIVKIYDNYHDLIGISSAELVEVVKSHPLRIKPPCKHFDTCASCSIQHLSYDSQLNLKRDFVQSFYSSELMKSLIIPKPSTNLSNNPDSTASLLDSHASSSKYWIQPVVPCPVQKGFRSKITPHHPSVYANTALKGLGFLQKGRSRAVVDMDECYVATDAINDQLKHVRSQIVGKSVPFDRRASTCMYQNSFINSS